MESTDLGNGVISETSIRYIVMFSNGMYLTASSQNPETENLDEASVFHSVEMCENCVVSLPESLRMGCSIRRVAIELFVEKDIVEYRERSTKRKERPKLRLVN